MVSNRLERNALRQNMRGTNSGKYRPRQSVLYPTWGSSAMQGPPAPAKISYLFEPFVAFRAGDVIEIEHDGACASLTILSVAINPFTQVPEYRFQTADGTKRSAGQGLLLWMSLRYRAGQAIALLPAPKNVHSAVNVAFGEMALTAGFPKAD